MQRKESKRTNCKLMPAIAVQVFGSKTASQEGGSSSEGSITKQSIRMLIRGSTLYAKLSV